MHPFPLRRSSPAPSPPHRWFGAVLVVCVGVLAACGPTTAAPTRSPATTGVPTTGATATTVPVPSTAPTTTSTTPPDGSLTLFTEPADGYLSIDQLIAGARRSIDLTMYELADPQVEGLLAAARQRGVAVRVLLDHAYRGGSVNAAAYARLVSSGVAVRWATDSVIFHQKTLTVDDQESAVMTGNLTSEYYPTTRDFTVIDRNPAAVAAIESVFASDWNGAPVAGGPTVGGLVWSPGSESALVGLINSADTSIAVENEEMDSEAVETALEAAARRGVAVEVTMTADPEWADSLATLSGAGVRVAIYPDTSGVLYIHAKVMVIDGKTAFIGSQNFSTSSLDYNRELGVITDDAGVVGPLSATLAVDFAGGTPMS